MASVLFRSFVDGLVPPQSTAGEERLVASRVLAAVFPVAVVGARNVGFQVFRFHVRLIAGVKGALVGPVVCMRSHVGCESGRPIERLDAARVCALDRLELAGEHAAGGCRHSRHWRG